MVSSRTLLTVLAALSATGAKLDAQGRRLTADELFEDAERYARSGDTTLAIATLRRAVDRDRDHPDAVFSLGTLLARTASSVEREFTQRAEAEELLDRSFRLRDGDPAVLLELGLLKYKQNIRVDARRVLENALDRSPGDGLSPRDAAEAHYSLARIIEDELRDFQHLMFLAPAFRQFGSASADPLGSTSASAICPAGVSFFCYNYTRTRDFNLLFEEVATPASDRAQTALPLIEQHYEAALSYDPTHRLAARGLMALYLREGQTDEFLRVANETVSLDRSLPYPHVFLGLALYRQERWEDAHAAFQRGLARMDGEEQAAFEDVNALLKKGQRSGYGGLPGIEKRRYENVLWAKSDPLYLIPGNERWLEHVSRVAYAELNFGAPALGLRGWESDRGVVYIRYGPPRRVWHISTGTTLTSARGGRWILWNYRIDAPSFIFFGQAGNRSVRFDQAANTESYADELAEVESSSVFRSRAIHTWIDLPYQLARLRGSDPELTDVLAYVAADPERFLLFEGDSVTAALFVFAPQHGDSVTLTSSLQAEATGNLVFHTELYPANYEFAIEALARSSRVAGTERGELPVLGFLDEGLGLSDLIVADGVTPRVPDPVRWTDFSIGASRDLTFGMAEPIHLYFEIYGLEIDDNDEAHYELELSVEDVSQEGLISSVVRSLGTLVGLGDDADTRINFERRAQPRDGIVAEYLSLTLSEVEPGDYRVRVLVRDERTDAELTIDREIVIVR